MHGFQTIMRRASFKIQKVLDEISEKQARQAMRERGRTGESFQGQRRTHRLKRQKSGCKNPFVPVQHGRQGEVASFQPLKTLQESEAGGGDLVTASDTLEQDNNDDDDSVCKASISTQSILSDEGDKKKVPVTTKVQRKVGRARQYSVIMEEEEEERIGGRRDCEEEMLQPIKHLSGEWSLGKIYWTLLSIRCHVLNQSLKNV